MIIIYQLIERITDMDISLDTKTIFIIETIVIGLAFLYYFLCYFLDIYHQVYQAIRPPNLKSKYFKRKYSYNKSIKTFPYLIVTMLLFELSILGVFFTTENHTPASIQEEDLSVKIEEISKDLLESSQTLLNIQTELENRISTVEELKKEAEIAENMISLTEEQVAAIQSKLNQELEASSGKSLLYNILISTLFFLLGLIMQPILNLFKKKTTAPAQQDKSIKGKYTNEEVEQVIRVLETIGEKKQMEDSSEL